MPAIKLRAKTLALARMLYYAVLISASVLSPYFLQTWNLKGKAAFPAFGFTLFSLIWAFIRLPEMKGCVSRLFYFDTRTDSISLQPQL